MDIIKLTDTPLQVAEALSAVVSPEAGGVDIFIGTTRAHFHAQLGQLVALNYSAYPDMALSEMRKIGVSARGQWHICRLLMLHRTGRCAVGESSVIIAVSCPHRAEAFAACRFLIDQLKALVPIWKEEVYERGAVWPTPP
jgi:molybdopterin synthase catalytic subunit